MSQADIETVPKITHQPQQPIIKIILRNTDIFVLFERKSRIRQRFENEPPIEKKVPVVTRLCDAETQTMIALYKCRSVNTGKIKESEVGTYVSNYEMYDTYADVMNMNRSTKSLGTDSNLEVTTYSNKGGQTPDLNFGNNLNFKISQMIIQRQLASNVFREYQKRFRNIVKPDPLDVSIRYRYKLNVLWSYKMVETIGKAVSSISLCPNQGDIIAIGYGVYKFTSFTDRRVGYACIWNMKNPVNPERQYRYPVPVMAVSFAKQSPQLLAIGLYNGCVDIQDIQKNQPILKTYNPAYKSFSVAPISQLTWIQTEKIEELLSVSEDGLIIKYTIVNGYCLIGNRQMKLNKIEIIDPAVSTAENKTIEAKRDPKVYSLQLDPLKSDIYYIGTDDGWIHKCSIFYPHQHIGLLKVHKCSVFEVQYSPYSPKIFLTCSDDWYIRIWVEGLIDPVIELKYGLEAIHSANWCPINSTILACSTKSKVYIWDIRRSILKVASTTTFGVGNVLLTTCRFTNCGRSLVVGDEEGTTYICALDDMPFSPHFQYEELYDAIINALIHKPELQRQVKNSGYLGY